MSLLDPLDLKLPRATAGAFITYEDFHALYKWFQTVNPTSLLYKVWFDITYYFMMTESDAEGMLEMRRDSLVLHVDQKRRRYVTLKDQRRFSGHAEVTDCGRMELRMYEIPGSPRCPVTSLVTYVKRTHPAVRQLWQRPREAYRPSEPGVWYDMFPLGLSRLARMMTQLSRLAGLSVNYRTCHVLNTALRHLELAGLSPRLLQELKDRRSRQAERPERGSCRPDGEPCDVTVACQRRSLAARKRKAMAM